MNDFDKIWVGMNKEIIHHPNPFYISRTGHKYLLNHQLHFPGSAWKKGPSLKMEDLMYANYMSKTRQLKRNYLDEEAAKTLQDSLMERIATKKEFTSVTMIMNNQKKRKESQGFCMSNAVVSYIYPSKEYLGGKLSVTFNYRITETIMKFGADLIFLRKEVIPRLVGDLRVDEVNFNLSNLYLSPCFLPIFYPFWSPVDMLVDTEGDTVHRRVRREIVHGIKLPVKFPDVNKYNFVTRQKMHELAFNNTTKDEAIWIEEYLKERGEW